MSTSPEQRAEALLDTVQRTVRERLPSIDEDEQERAAANRSVQHLQSQMRYLREAAMAGWTHRFRRALSLAHSVRKVKIDPREKLAARGAVTCDACGQ